MILLPLLHLNENFAWCKHWTICCRRIYFRKSCTFFATFPNPSPYTTHHHHHRREWMLHIENVYFLLPTEYRYFIPFHNNRLFAKSKYSALRNKRNDVMSLLLGIFWPEKGWRLLKRSVFIACSATVRSIFLNHTAYLYLLVSFLIYSALQQNRFSDIRNSSPRKTYLKWI